MQFDKDMLSFVLLQIKDIFMFCARAFDELFIAHSNYSVEENYFAPSRGLHINRAEATF